MPTPGDEKSAAARAPADVLTELQGGVPSGRPEPIGASVPALCTLPEEMAWRGVNRYPCRALSHGVGRRGERGLMAGWGYIRLDYRCVWEEVEQEL